MRHVNSERLRGRRWCTGTTGPMCAYKLLSKVRREEQVSKPMRRLEVWSARMRMTAHSGTC